MSWTTHADLRAQVQRLWDRGDLLRAAVADVLDWPLRLSLKAPSGTDLSDRFEAVRDWVREWVRAVADTPHVRIEWRAWNHRVQGAQRLPAEVWIDSLPVAVALIGKTSQVRRFEEQWQRTAGVQPALLAWMSKRPLKALELADRWERLLAVVTWLQANPRPSVYLRQIDVPGVDSKFIESNRGVLAELFDTALAPAVIDTSARGAAQFARRFGLLGKPERIRFRSLDPAMLSLPGCVGMPDIMLDAASFSTLALPVDRVFVTENEVNFLAFPMAARSLVVFGAGYGWEALARADWLNRCRVHYWGDIDTHGFAILDQLRGYLPHAASFLMDRETLLGHRAHWGEEPAPARHELSRLTVEETAVYDDLRLDHFQPRLRLEQERIGFGWVCDRLAVVMSRGLQVQVDPLDSARSD